MTTLLGGQYCGTGLGTAASRKGRQVETMKPGEIEVLEFLPQRIPQPGDRIGFVASWDATAFPGRQLVWFEMPAQGTPPNCAIPLLKAPNKTALEFGLSHTANGIWRSSDDCKWNVLHRGEFNIICQCGMHYFRSENGCLPDTALVCPCGQTIIEYTGAMP